jgi:Fe-S cluster assembly ATP-binding protein
MDGERADKEILLDIKDLVVSVDDKEILHNVNLSVPSGETQVIFGPNGGGKTTLLMTIMGFPRYKIVSGKIHFKGIDITGMPVDERARLGIGIMFQRPPVVRGVKTHDMVAACLMNDNSEELISELASKANMTDFLARDINHGFSGGEIKRSELLQLSAQSPNLVLLDEPESGVDLENISLIGSLINNLLGKVHPIRERTNSGLVITHTGHILNYINARTGYVMFEGKIICEGEPLDMLNTIKEKGYRECVKCLRK